MMTDNSGLQWVRNRLLYKDQRITQAAALIESARYADKYLAQPAENIAGSGNNFQKDLLAAGTVMGANILRPLATELALKAVYEWENDLTPGNRNNHKLLELWNSLSQKSRKRLEALYLQNYHSHPGPDKTVEVVVNGTHHHLPEMPIVWLLEIYNNAFHQWRYFTEPSLFQTGELNRYIHNLDFVVMAAWTMLSMDTEMIPKIFSIED